MGAPRRPEVQYEKPTAEEEARGEAFLCRGCNLRWPTRLAHRYEFLCEPCGRGLRRERERSRRLRLRGINAPTPVIPKRKVEVEVEGGRVETVTDPTKLSTAVASATDAAVLEAQRRGRMKKPGTGLVKR
jgi:hypothetical protein